MRLAILVVVVTAGCSNLPDRDVTCGNGVIDPGEDCDNSTASCNQCRLLCPTGTDAECRPDSAGPALAGYVCGADNVCHAPSGVFTKLPSVTFPFVVNGGTSADLDGDRIGDMVGFSDIHLDVHFGDFDSLLAQHADILVPYSNTNPTIRRLASGRGDVLVPTADGIAAYTAESKTIVAYPFATPLGARGGCATSNGNPIGSFTIDKTHVGFVVRNDSGALGVAVLDVLDPMDCAYLAACGLTAGASDTVLYDHYDTRSTGKGAEMIAIAAPTGMATEAGCTLFFDGADTTMAPSGTLKPLGSFVGGRAPVVFARAAAADVCPALFVQHAVPGGSVDYFPAASQTRPCSLTFTATPLGFVAPGSVPSGRIPLVPAIGSSGPDALVVVTGGATNASSVIYSLSGSNASPIYASVRPLYPVFAADLDGDGTIEGVAGVAGAGPSGGQPDFDVLYRTGPSASTFVAYRIATQSTPTHVALGDYDGNGLADIAYTERVGSGERLMIAYGTRDRPLDPIEIATFSTIITFNRVDFPDSITPEGVIDDLIVVDLDTNNQPQLTNLHGNPQRSMLAYFDPRPPTPIGESRFVATVGGNFVPTPGATDLIAIEDSKAGINVRLAAGIAGSEGLAANPSGMISTFTDCSRLCVDGAQFLAWPIGDGAGKRDVVIAIDQTMFGPHHIVTIDPRQLGTSAAIIDAAADAVSAILPGTQVFSMWGADIHGNGQPDLVVVAGNLGFMPGTMLSIEILDCTVSPEGVVTGCQDLIGQVSKLAGDRCLGAETGPVSARGRLDPPPDSSAADVLVLCDGNVHRIHSDGSAFTSSVVLENAAGFTFIALGDLDGDHLVDLVGVDFDLASGISTIHVFPQCEARDIECIATNQVPP